MSYEETIRYLYERLPMFQRMGQAAYKASLNNTLALDRQTGHPHKKFSSIHIAGTNGKGSASHMLASVFVRAGYATGLYTSPHMKDFRERIRVNGECIPEGSVTGFVERHRQIIESLQPSFFEITVAMAFDHFARCGVDLAVIETGMGGRLDSTNIIIPLVSLITNIGLDHTRYLGDTLEKIAAEKAGIIKPGVPVVIGQAQAGLKELFTEKAAENDSGILFAGEEFTVQQTERIKGGGQVVDAYKSGALLYKGLELDLAGDYQLENLTGVLGVLETLKQQGMIIAGRDVRGGLQRVIETTGLRGRWEVIGQEPAVICDAAHNREGLMQVASQLQSMQYKKLHIVFGTVDEKDPAAMTEILPADASWYFTGAEIPRAMDPGLLQKKAGKSGRFGSVHPSPSSALAAARSAAGTGDLILVTGSSYVVAELLP